MKKQIKTSILCALSVLTMSACSNKIDCDIEIVHCHEYIDRDNGIKRYIESEVQNDNVIIGVLLIDSKKGKIPVIIKPKNVNIT